MKYLMIIIMIGIQTLSTAYASENSDEMKPKFMFDTKIYKLSKDSSATKGMAPNLENAVLEGTPSLLTVAGETASLKIGVGDEGDQNDMIMMHFLPAANGETFDVKLELLDGNNTVISHIEDSAIDQQLNFSAKLNDVTRVFSLNATKVSSPSASTEEMAATVAKEGQCGRVSVFMSPPRNKRFFKTTIFKVNDNNVDIAKTTHQLAPGKHTIHVSNAGGSFSGAAMRRAKSRGKGLEIIIKPNVNYHIGAKFVGEKRYKLRQEENWEPVVWKTTNQKCEL